MRFKSVSTMVFICVVIGLQACQTQKGYPSIDLFEKDKIWAGPGLYDWLIVRCLDRINEDHTISHTYCDNSPIESIIPQKDSSMYLIQKKHSLWKFYNDPNFKDSTLQLLSHD